MGNEFPAASFSTHDDRSGPAAFTLLHPVPPGILTFSILLQYYFIRFFVILQDCSFLLSVLIYFTEQFFKIPVKVEEKVGESLAGQLGCGSRSI